MILTCPQCGARYQIEESRLAGGQIQVRCSSCNEVFQASGPSAVRTEAESARILVCDDAPFFRSMLEDILTEAGFTVQTVANGEDAVKAAASEPPDLLVLDLQLPGMSGFEVVRHFRKEGEAKKFPILAMSAVYTDSSDVMDLEDVGADDYIGKKFKPEHLVKRVRRLLGLPLEDG